MRIVRIKDVKRPRGTSELCFSTPKAVSTLGIHIAGAQPSLILLAKAHPYVPLPVMQPSLVTSFTCLWFTCPVLLHLNKPFSNKNRTEISSRLVGSNSFLVRFLCFWPRIMRVTQLRAWSRAGLAQPAVGTYRRQGLHGAEGLLASCWHPAHLWPE